MNISKTIHLLSLMLEGYKTGNFKSLFPVVANNCQWESNWKTDCYSGPEEIEKYYVKKGAILAMSRTFPSGYIVDLFGSEDRIDGKGLYLLQSYNEEVYDLIVTIKVDSKCRISMINLCMKELFSFRKYNAAIPQF